MSNLVTQANANTHTHTRNKQFYVSGKRPIVSSYLGDTMSQYRSNFGIACGVQMFTSLCMDHLCHISSGLCNLRWCIPPAFGVNIPKSSIIKWKWHIIFFGYDRFSSASQMFVENRAGNFETRMRRLIYGFRERLNASKNSLVICLMNSVAWSSSEIKTKVGKMLIYAVMN